MAKKLALPSLFFTGSSVDDATRSLSSPCSPPPSMSAASSSTATSWQWPSCTQARTVSFHSRSAEVSSSSQDYKTRAIVNPTYCDGPRDDSAERSFLSATDSSASTTASEPSQAGEVDEAIIRRIRSTSRLFFDPQATSSIVSKPEAAAAAFGGATALAIDSADPYGDFRRSMEEMVLSRGSGGDDWGWLEEMLGWYLRANGKKTHGLIVGAFVDLLVGLSSVKQSDQC